MKKLSGAPVARQQVFTLSDGSFVVQWDERNVQELLTGRYRQYDHKQDFGHPITDYELNQLKLAGRVEHHNRSWVWLYALPEKGRFGQPRLLDRGDRIRAYYLTSTLPKAQLPQIQALLTQEGLAQEFLARSRNSLVVILSKNGMPFRHLRDAEKAQKLLEVRSPDTFSTLAVAFIETKLDMMQHTGSEPESDAPDLSLGEIIASQEDTNSTAGKYLILSVSHEEERQEFTTLFEGKMLLEVHQATTGMAAVQAVEDRIEQGVPPDLLVTDSKLPDMHVWQLLNKLKEIGVLQKLAIVVITDEPAFGANVAKVDYLVRPVAIARLRHSVWTVLHSKVQTPTPPRQAGS